MSQIIEIIQFLHNTISGLYTNYFTKFYTPIQYTNTIWFQLCNNKKLWKVKDLNVDNAKILENLEYYIIQIFSVIYWVFITLGQIY